MKARAVPNTVPRHVAITMDGNGRWAASRGLPRSAGHKAGLEPVRMCIRECARRGVEALTLFAFSSENWRRPVEEVTSLMGLFLEALEREIAELHANRVRVRFIGDRRTLSVRLQTHIAAAEGRTGGNDGLRLQVAVSYGGRWDIVKAAQRLAKECSSGSIRPEEIDEQRFARGQPFVSRDDLRTRSSAHDVCSFRLRSQLATRAISPPAEPVPATVSAAVAIQAGHMA